MPKRQDLKKIMIIGSGPIVIGQAAEFDFSGTQASLALREEGYRSVIVNSNPATIQTDLETADSVYLEPLTAEFLEKIIAKERPQGLLAGFGGQTGLNLASEMGRRGVFEKYGVELLGTDLRTIDEAEDRDRFRNLMIEIGEPVPKSRACLSLDEIMETVREEVPLPVLLRPAYTLGGTGSGIAWTKEELAEMGAAGLRASPIGQVLVEENLVGWKEFEYEVVRDNLDNCITICNMENINPMGVHTGESMVVTPAQTLTDKEHQILRNVSLKIIRKLRIAGGCNIQFAVHPTRWEYRVIEVNPRVSRSSALASKATGYPIARVSAKIAVGMNLDEIPNAVTRKTTAAFEPTIDYVVVKIPRWPFDKFRSVDRRLGTQMKSTGEVMSIGASIEEALLKAVCSLEIGRSGLSPEPLKEYELVRELQEPTDRLLFCIAEALRRGYTVAKIVELTHVDGFFIDRIQALVRMEDEIRTNGLDDDRLLKAKRLGFSDEDLGRRTGTPGLLIRERRQALGIEPGFNMVDTCAGEFEAATPYYYSTYHAERSVRTTEPRKKRVIVVGAGPIRIGQGIEFDYCCVQAAQALKEEGVEAILVNNNPETVSTDFDVASRLYFEPLTLEHLLNVIEREEPEGIILQFGGQTSVNLAMPLWNLIQEEKLPVRILGTPPTSIHRAEDRKQFSDLLLKLGLRQPPYGTGFTYDEVKSVAETIGYPVLVRPSYVLGGRGMEIVYEENELRQFMTAASSLGKEHPILVDKYIADATEVDVDALCDGEDVFVAAVQEHIEQAGVHSGDSYAVIPPFTLKKDAVREIEAITEKIARGLDTKGLINIQFAVKNGDIYILEANPRASRTAPFVSKSIGLPLAKAATRIMLGKTLKEMKIDRSRYPYDNGKLVSIKGPVFPFLKLPGVDPILGPEMKSTGEVMSIDRDFGAAYYKAVLADNKFSREGTVFISVRDGDKPAILGPAKELQALGFAIMATRGTAEFLKANGIDARIAYRLNEHRAPNLLEIIRERKVHLIINTPTMTSSAKRDGYTMRRLAVEMNIPFLTAINSVKAEIEAIKALRRGGLGVRSLNDYYAEIRSS